MFGLLNPSVYASAGYNVLFSITPVTIEIWATSIQVYLIRIPEHTPARCLNTNPHHTYRWGKSLRMAIRDRRYSTTNL